TKKRRLLMHPLELQGPPQPPRSPRIQPLARLPIFFELAGKRAIIAGNNAPVAWKAELLSAAGANVEVFAERPCQELCALALEAPGASLTLRHRAWRTEDFTGAAVAVGGFENETNAARFAEAARARRVAVNDRAAAAQCDLALRHR